MDTERPKSRLPDGKVNPAYTKWRKAQKVAESPVAVMEAPTAVKRAKEICNALVSAPGALEEYKQKITDPVKGDGPNVHSRPSPPQVDVVADGVKVAGKFFPKESPDQILTLKCIKAAKNPKFVFCDLNGVKVPVRCKRGLSKKMPGKRIKVSVDNSGEKPIYTHIQ